MASFVPTEKSGVIAKEKNKMKSPENLGREQVLNLSDLERDVLRVETYSELEALRRDSIKEGVLDTNADYWGEMSRDFNRVFYKKVFLYFLHMRPNIDEIKARLEGMLYSSFGSSMAVTDGMAEEEKAVVTEKEYGYYRDILGSIYDDFMGDKDTGWSLWHLRLDKEKRRARISRREVFIRDFMRGVVDSYGVDGDKGAVKYLEMLRVNKKKEFEEKKKKVKEDGKNN